MAKFVCLVSPSLDDCYGKLLGEGSPTFTPVSNVRFEMGKQLELGTTDGYLANFILALERPRIRCGKWLIVGS